MKKIQRSLVIIIVLFFISSGQTFASWAYQFVVYSGNVYVTESIIDANKIDKKIGKVTRYSDQEGTYSGNFSNVFPKGTEYYSIVGVSKEKEIAIKVEENKFIKSVYQGKYGGKSTDNFEGWIYIFIGIVVLVLLAVVLMKKKRKFKPL